VSSAVLVPIFALDEYIDRHNENPSPFIWTDNVNNALANVIKAQRVPYTIHCVENAISGSPDYDSFKGLSLTVKVAASPEIPIRYVIIPKIRPHTSAKPKCLSEKKLGSCVLAAGKELLPSK
jgi:hypothetical protein